MSALPHEIEASDAMLAEAAKLDLVAMRHVHELVLASDDAKEVGTLVHAYARVSRCMRQNLALLAKQKADRAKAEREAARTAPSKRELFDERARRNAWPGRPSVSFRVFRGSKRLRLRRLPA